MNGNATMYLHPQYLIVAGILAEHRKTCNITTAKIKYVNPCYSLIGCQCGYETSIGSEKLIENPNEILFALAHFADKLELWKENTYIKTVPITSNKNMIAIIKT